MKKIILGIACLFIAGQAFAANQGYNLKMRLSLDGKYISSPQLFVKEGETGSIINHLNGKKTYVDVVATEGSIQGHGGILMKFVVGTIDKDGKKTIVGTPQILARENEQAKISVAKENGQEILALAVLTKRISF